MGRPNTPSHLHLVRGNPGKRARNYQEPDPAYLDNLEPPAHLTPIAAAVWRELAPKLRESHLLTVLDAVALEAACDAIAMYRLATAKVGEMPLQDNHDEDGKPLAQSLNPWGMIQAMSFKRVNAMLQQFGMTPAARARVAVTPQGSLFGNDPLGQFTQGRPA